MDTTELDDPIVKELRARCDELLQEAKQLRIGSQEWIAKLDQVCIVSQHLREYESRPPMPSEPTN